MKQRNPFFDNAKLFLIYLVVLGHISNSNNKLSLATTEWIFSFHMPLFIFISGYFTKITDKKKYLTGVLNFTETLAVFTCIHMLVEYLQGKPINNYQQLIYPKWTLWFLFSLIWWRIMLYLTPSLIRNNSRVLIIISILLCFLMGFLPIDTPFSFQRTFAFLPFFIVGYVAGKNNKEIKARRGKFLMFLFLISIWIFYFIVPKNIIRLLYQNTCFFHGPLSSPILNFTFRVGFLFFASCMMYAFLSIVPRKKLPFTHLGQLSLFIYLYHSIILSWRSNLCDYFHLPTNFIFCFLYSLIVLVIIWLMSKVRFFHWLLNPISSTIKKRL